MLAFAHMLSLLLKPLQRVLVRVRMTARLFDMPCW
jgi:hypothetical protein